MTKHATFFLMILLGSIARAEMYACSAQTLAKGNPTDVLANFSIDTSIDTTVDVNLPSGDEVKCYVSRGASAQLSCVFLYSQQGPSAAATVEVGSTMLLLQTLAGPRPTVVSCIKI